MGICFDILESGPAGYDPARSPEEVLGPGYRTVEKVRNILMDGPLYCLVHSAGEGYWTFPGGGMEPGEASEQAVLRETVEETGAQVRALQAIGLVREFRVKTGVLQTTYFFASQLESLGAPHLTREEEALGTTVEWLPARQAAERLSREKSPLYHRQFSRARDTSLFERYLRSQTFLEL